MIKRNKKEFDSQMARLMTVTGSKNGNQLASRLGITRQSVSASLQKREVPSNWFILAADETECSLDWLVYGIEPNERIVELESELERLRDGARKIYEIATKKSAGEEDND